MALSVIEREALRGPKACGLNSNDTVQLADAARLDPQVVDDFTKESGSVPAREIELSVTDPVPMFLIVTVCAAEIDPTLVEENVRLVGERVRVNVAGSGQAFTRFVTLTDPSPVARS